MKTYQIIDHLPDACLVVTSEIICEIKEAKKAGHGHILYKGVFATTVDRIPFTDLLVNFLKCPVGPGAGVYLSKLKDYALEIEEIMIEFGHWDPKTLMR